MSADSYRRGLHKPRRILCLLPSDRNLADLLNLLTFLRPTVFALHRRSTVRILRVLRCSATGPMTSAIVTEPPRPPAKSPASSSSGIPPKRRGNTVLLAQACAVFEAYAFSVKLPTPRV